MCFYEQGLMHVTLCVLLFLPCTLPTGILSQIISQIIQQI